MRARFFWDTVYFALALSTDAECSKKDFIRLAKESVSISEDEAGKIWGGISFWAEPRDVYTIADEQAYFAHCSKRKCDTSVRSLLTCHAVIMFRSGAKRGQY